MIYFIRHGQSQANVERIIASRDYPAPLTQKGREQAKIAGYVIKTKKLTIDNIVASPLERARDTALIIAATIGFDASQIQLDERLIEYDMGSFTGMPIHGALEHEIISAEDTEDPQAFQDRVMACLTQMSSKPGNTLLVSHDYIGRIIGTARLHMDPKNFYQLKEYPNAQLVELS